MNKSVSTAAAAVLASLAAAAMFAAPGATKAAKAAPVASLSPPQVVAARQAAFGLSASTFGGMKGVVEAGGEVKPLAFGARNLARWARILPSMFPIGTGTPESHAKPALWQARADFEAKAADYSAATTRLADAAQANDKAAFADAWRATGAACKGCHDLYRAEERH